MCRQTNNNNSILPCIDVRVSIRCSLPACAPMRNGKLAVCVWTSTYNLMFSRYHLAYRSSLRTSKRCSTGEGESIDKGAFGRKTWAASCSERPPTEMSWQREDAGTNEHDKRIRSRGKRCSIIITFSNPSTTTTTTRITTRRWNSDNSMNRGWMPTSRTPRLASTPDTRIRRTSRRPSSLPIHPAHRARMRRTTR